jgi:hypothetical protein
LDITALLTEDDFFDAFEQLHDWYVDNGPLPATITSEEISND